MNRGILFRGRSLNTGNWVYGDLRQDKVRRKVYIEYEVDPSSVGQYTGLKDKNGKKIFEGDILKDEDFKYVVCFYDARFIVVRLSIFNKLPKGASFSYGRHIDKKWICNRVEVIGNIYK